MSERGRKLFNQYIVGLLADAENVSSQLEANVDALKIATIGSDLRLAEIEQEVGALSDALATRLHLMEDSDREDTRLASQVVDLKTASDASGLRMVKIEEELEGIHDANADS
jgi:hypothetical protein